MDSNSQHFSLWSQAGPAAHLATLALSKINLCSSSTLLVAVNLNPSISGTTPSFPASCTNSSTVALSKRQDEGRDEAGKGLALAASVTIVSPHED